MTSRDEQQSGAAALGRALLLPAAALLLVACAEEDRGAPFVIDGAFILPASGTILPLGVADPIAPLDGELNQTPTRGVIRLLLSEPLDGDSLQTVERDSNTGQVVELTGRVGIARVAPVDGSLVASSVTYRADVPAIDVATDVPSASGSRVPTFMPAGTAILVHVLADRVRDRDGNLLAASRLESGEPVRDTDGRDVGATVAFTTEPLAVTGVSLSDYGAGDDPTTPEDETVAYDALSTITFNTGIDAASAMGRIHFLVPGGAFIPTRVQATPTPAGQLPTALEVAPLMPLAPATAYELRVEPGLTDAYGVPLIGEPQHFAFTTN